MRHVIASQQFITSDYIIDELVAYVRLVGPKVSHRWVNGLKRKLLPYAKKYDRGASHPLRDMSDSPILQLAVDNSALIVTGDKDLLDFNGQSNMLIVYISEYLALFDAASR